MKMVIAYIRHEAFEADSGRAARTRLPVAHRDRREGIGTAARDHRALPRGGADQLPRPKVKIECVVETPDVTVIVDTILKHGRTGAVGDGKVFVLPVEEAYRVRTGEAGAEILQAHPDTAGVPTG